MKRFFRGLMAWKGGACASFTASVVIYLAIAWLCGEESAPVSTLFSLLLLCGAGSFLQWLCFSARALRHLRYSLRLGLFALMFLPLLAGCARAFDWIPAREPGAWALFGLAFLAVFALMTAGFEIYFHIAGRRYDGLLGQYRRRHADEKI